MLKVGRDHGQATGRPAYLCSCCALPATATLAMGACTCICIAPTSSRRKPHLWRAGFEAPIIKGGEALFKHHNVWYIMAGAAGEVLWHSWSVGMIEPGWRPESACTARPLSPSHNKSLSFQTPTECNIDIIKQEGQVKFIR